MHSKPRGAESNSQSSEKGQVLSPPVTTGPVQWCKCVTVFSRASIARWAGGAQDVSTVTENAAVLQLRVTKATDPFLPTLAEPRDAQFLTDLRVLKPCGILLPHTHQHANMLRGPTLLLLVQIHGMLCAITAAPKLPQQSQRLDPACHDGSGDLPRERWCKTHLTSRLWRALKRCLSCRRG